MQQRKPVQVLKKKVEQDMIVYKIQWSNGSKSTEPLPELCHDIEALKLIQSYEIAHYKKDMEEEPPLQKKVQQEVHQQQEKLADHERAQEMEKPQKVPVEVRPVERIPEIPQEVIPEKAPEKTSEEGSEKQQHEPQPQPQHQPQPQSQAQPQPQPQLQLQQEKKQDKVQDPVVQERIVIKKVNFQEDKPKAHKPRQSIPCIVKQLRNNHRPEFYVQFEDQMSGWIGVDEAKKQFPIALCDFLLAKVKFNGTKK